MSDSDNDLMPNNVFSFQNENTTVWAGGPNINASNLTGLTFRNNVLTSTMQMPRNFEREKFNDERFDHRRPYYRRETSPMSMYSGSDMRARNLNCYLQGKSQSVFNGRSGSPMSIRTIDSTASVSATDIALAFKNEKFNRYDLRIIQDAYNKFIIKKHQFRKRIDKRRNIRLLMKGVRRKSGYDSGELGSDSSSSSNDCRSTKGSVFRDNVSNGRLTRSYQTDFKQTIMESDMYKDCSEDIRQSKFRNMVTVGSRSVNSVQQDLHKPLKPGVQGKQSKNGFLWPSQRFNRSNASVPIHEDCERVKDDKKKIKQTKAPSVNMRNISDSDQEEIFSELTVKENVTLNIPSERQHKRSLDNEDHTEPKMKRTKISSPIRKNRSNKKLSPIKATAAPDFEFVKPSFPVRKSSNLKTQQEKLISKSSLPKDIAENVPKNYESPKPIEDKQTLLINPAILNNKEENQIVNLEPSQPFTSDVAMRPSFIKRKLYTQQLDVTEKRNASSDSLSANSPGGNVYNAIHKVKHKARKLVTSQSCLSRDVQEDDNLIDLIHKIVPPDRINITQTTRSDVFNNKQNKSKDDDRWDVTSVITTCNDDNVSDTFTDEEIFKSHKTVNEKLTTQTKPTDDAKIVKDCRIVIENMPDKITHTMDKKKDNELGRMNTKHIEQSKNENQKNLQGGIKSFWDTDLESDVECSIAPRNNKSAGNLSIQKESKKQIQPKSNLKTTLPNIDSNRTLNSTVNNMQKMSTSYLNIRSHRTKVRQCCNDQTYSDTLKTITRHNKNKTIQIESPPTKETPKPLSNMQVNHMNASQVSDNNTSRPVRSCRISKNSTMNSSKLDLSMNTVTNTTVGSNHSVKSKLSPVKNLAGVVKNKVKNIQEVKSRGSDVSFLLATDIAQNKNVFNESRILTRSQSREIISTQIDVSISSTPNKKSTVVKNNRNKNNQNLNNSKIIPKGKSAELKNSKKHTPQRNSNKKSRATKN